MKVYLQQKLTCWTGVNMLMIISLDIEVMGTRMLMTQRCNLPFRTGSRIGRLRPEKGTPSARRKHLTTAIEAGQSVEGKRSQVSLNSLSGSWELFQLLISFKFFMSIVEYRTLGCAKRYFGKTSVLGLSFIDTSLYWIKLCKI